MSRHDPGRCTACLDLQADAGRLAARLLDVAAGNVEPGRVMATLENLRRELGELVEQSGHCADIPGE